MSGPVPSEGHATTGPPPEGSLDDFPLPVLFTHVLAHRLSGSLVLKSPRGGGEGSDVVVFADGAPTRIRTAKLIAPLGEMLVRLGVIADVDLQAALLRAQRAKERLGRQLVSDSLVDRRVLLRALREQILVRLRAIAALPSETIYEFHPNADLLDEGAPTNHVACDALAALLSLVRAWPERRRIDEAILPFLRTPVRLHPLARLDRFELDDAERAVIAKLKSSGEPSHEALLQSSVAPERTIRALLYALHVTHHLDDGSGAPPLDVEPPSDPVASLRDSALNVGIDPLRTSAAIVALGAADDHREALALWRAGNLQAAEVLAARAVARDPGKPDYKALLGVVLAQQGGRTRFKRGLSLLNEAITAAPQSDRALVWRATVLRDAGRIDAAIRDWRAALAANPANDEAKIALKRAQVHSDHPELRRSSRLAAGRPAGAGSTTPRRPQPSVGSRNQWILLAVLVVSTVALLVVYFRMRG
ncbi:MAG: hypothetical protein HYV09_01970 [Deltaproteobacteria bacterium]|nr:hypothetical protein [Deltaproteobacteria bacterium]